ncbi:glycosyl hydrolase family 28-related protein [Microlunatus parietis]|uniref:Rhamnogalacturonase A/B/Epimerase-like pectate lyase domain-containing protein n=1 Tax=Microlunatus parietis TaxID=682979 RepID=A0A7Y9LDW5_9ACTN|nr:right-handed parallel beta-helix repeat-containing protein [Microlunatus parietis]NYE72406.1 hypothetical protein [Microlunatus parietis]
MSADHAPLVSRRSALTVAAAVAGGSLIAGRAPSAARAETGMVINLRDRGAAGDGVTDDTAVLNAALDDVEANGGGTIIFPPGTYPVGGPERPRLRDNLKIIGQDATLLKAGANGALFVALSRGRTGYGSGCRNVRISGLRFLGSYPRTRLMAPFALHHASDVVIENCVFEQVQGSRHSIDLGGCEDIVIRNCRWLGYYNNEGPAYNGAECIQVDYSYHGALSYNDSEGSHDGLMSRRITVEDCEFLPATVDGVDYPCPNPLGSHGLKEDSWFSDLRFAGNLIVDPIHGPSSDDSPNQGIALGAVHLPVSKRVVIENNRFVQTRGRMIRAISFAAASYVIATESDPNSFPPIKKTLENPLGCSEITVRNNRFEGFVAGDDETPLQSVIFLRGLPNGGELSNIEISGNTFVGLDHEGRRSTPAIEARHAAKITVSGNKLERGSVLARIEASCTDVVITSNDTSGITGPGPVIALAGSRYRIERNTLRADTTGPATGIAIGQGSPGRVARNELTGFTDPLEQPKPLPRGVTVRGNELE